MLLSNGICLAEDFQFDPVVQEIPDASLYQTQYPMPAPNSYHTQNQIPVNNTYQTYSDENYNNYNNYNE